MLKLWVSGINHKSTLEYINPDAYFDYYIYDYKFLESDFAKRVLYHCSGELKVINYANFLRPNGLYISTKEISSGAKNLLCMYEKGNSEGYLYDMLWCGDNCNKFIPELVQNQDLEVFSTRVYNPYDLLDDGSKLQVKVMETGDIVSNYNDFLDIIFSNKFWVDF